MLSWQIVAKLSTTSSVTWCVKSPVSKWNRFHIILGNVRIFNQKCQQLGWTSFCLMLCEKNLTVNCMYLQPNSLYHAHISMVCKFFSYFISWLSNTSLGSKCDDHKSSTRTTCPWRPVLATIGISGLTKVVIKKEAKLTCCFQNNTRNVFCTKSSELCKTGVAKSWQINTWMQWVSLEGESVWDKKINYIVSILS